MLNSWHAGEEDNQLYFMGIVFPDYESHFNNSDLTCMSHNLNMFFMLYPAAKLTQTSNIATHLSLKTTSMILLTMYLPACNNPGPSTIKVVFYILSKASML